MCEEYFYRHVQGMTISCIHHGIYCPKRTPNALIATWRVFFYGKRYASIIKPHEESQNTLMCNSYPGALQNRMGGVLSLTPDHAVHTNIETPGYSHPRHRARHDQPDSVCSPHGAHRAGRVVS